MFSKRLFFVLYCFLAELILLAQQMPGVITHPLDLQKELQTIQLFAPPAVNNTLEVDSGVFFYLPEAESSAELLFFSKSLRYKADESGNAVAPVRVFEDIVSRETLYLNADNEVIFRIPPACGYNPFWVLEAYYPDLNPPEYMLAQYDPARVVMKSVLLLCRIDPLSGEIVQAGVGKVPTELPKPLGTSLARDADRSKTMPRPENSPPLTVPRTVSSTNNISKISYKQWATRGIYVDMRYGDDSWDGKSRAKDKKTGPKRTIAGSIKALHGKGRIFIADGYCTENVNIRGMDVKVYINGAAQHADKPETAHVTHKSVTPPEKPIQKK